MVKRYNTGNPVPSGDPKDFSDNSLDIDDFVNGNEYCIETRVGRKILTLPGIEKKALESIDDFEGLINDKIIAQGGVQILNKWEKLKDATLSSEFIENNVVKKITPQGHGAIADGDFHPLSEFYDNLSDALLEFPNATSLDEGVDSLAIELAIEEALNSDLKTVFFYGHYRQDKEVVIHDHVNYVGSGVTSCIIQKKEGFLGRSAVSSRFDELTGTSSDNYNRGFSITGIKFHGMWMRNDWKSANNEYVNESGGGVFLYAQEYNIDFVSEYQAGVGVWLEARHTNTDFDTHHYFNANNIRSYVCKEECLIYKGGADVALGNIHTAFGGAFIQGDNATPRPRVSPNYPTIGRTDNIVADDGFEFEFIHSWGSQSGYTVNLNSGRFNGNMIMGESANQGALVTGREVYGMISRVDAHSCYGSLNGSTPDIDLNNNRGEGLSIGEIRIDRNGSQNIHGQVALRMGGGFSRIGSLIFNGRGNGAVGVESNGSFNTIDKSLLFNVSGNSYLGEPSTALINNPSTIGMNSINLECSSFPIVMNTLIDRGNEDIKIKFRGADAGLGICIGTVHSTVRSNNVSVNGVIGSDYFRSSGVLQVEFDATTTNRQTVDIPVKFPFYINARNFTVSPVLPVGVDNFNGIIDFLGISSVTRNSISVQCKISNASSSDDKLIVNVRYGVV